MATPDGALEHEVQELLKSKMPVRYGRPHVLVRWAGCDLDNLTNCEKAISAFEWATGRTLPRPPARIARPGRGCPDVTAWREQGP